MTIATGALEMAKPLVELRMTISPLPGGRFEIELTMEGGTVDQTERFEAENNVTAWRVAASAMENASRSCARYAKRTG